MDRAETHQRRNPPSDELMNDITLIAKMLNDMKACK